jgi:hypothetical protein
MLNGTRTRRQSGGLMVRLLGEPFYWRDIAAFACIMGALGFLFVGRGALAQSRPSSPCWGRLARART